MNQAITVLDMRRDPEAIGKLLNHRSNGTTEIESRSENQASS